MFGNSKQHPPALQKQMLMRIRKYKQNQYHGSDGKPTRVGVWEQFWLGPSFVLNQHPRPNLSPLKQKQESMNN
jgi:hypothetical protein